MPWRLIIFILIFAVFLAFITFNLENKCDIGFGFFKFDDVPVFLTVFTSFVLGLLCALPLAFHIKKKRTENIKKDKKREIDDTPLIIHAEPSVDEQIKKDAALAKERFLARRKGGKK